MMRARLTVTALAAVSVAALLAGCTPPETPARDALHTFTSLDEVFTSVDQVLGCDAAPAGRPVVAMGRDGIPLASSQKQCADHIQVDFYRDQDALAETYRMLSDSSQGTIHLAHGTNWMVVDLSGISGGQPSGADLERVAAALDGTYAVVGK